MRVTSFRAGRAAAFLSLASVGAMAACLAAPAQAQTAGARYQFDIPAQSLESALLQFNKVTGVQLVYPSSMTEGLSSQGASGSLTVDEALVRVLAGTGLTFRRMGTGTITIEKAVASDGGERVLGAVRVQGAQDGGLAGSTPVNGINGSRDVTATEGTGSYTSNALTVGSKAVASIKATPMAVSVITSQRLLDQNITDINSAMRDAPGVTVLDDNGSDLTYWSRGFQITQIQIDGGAPQNLGGDSSQLYRPILDMSLYDHVELVRGATGTFNAYGDPGGVINLVRKRPLDHAQMLLELQGGSWNWRRVSADITGPIAFDGAVRVRLIGSHQDNKFFYRIAELNRDILSATIEADISESTLLSAGFNYQLQNNVPWDIGLPRYFNGKSLDLPRSTSLALPWALNDRADKSFYGQLDQGLFGDWKLMLKATRISQASTQDIGAGVSSVGIDPVTRAGAYVAFPTRFKGKAKQTLLESTISGTFSLFGLEQKVIVGTNYAMSDYGGSGQFLAGGRFYPGVFIGKENSGGSYLLNIFDYDAYSWIPSPDSYSFQDWGSDYNDTRVVNSYASVDIQPLKAFHVGVAIRGSWYRSRKLLWTSCSQLLIDFQYCSKFGEKIYDHSGNLTSGSKISWPPSITGRWDASDNVSLYFGYTDIYQDRSSYLDKDKKPLPPLTGGNFEGGVKWVSDTKKLNINFSAYYTKQIRTTTVYLCRTDNNFPCSGSSSDAGQLNRQANCCYDYDPDSFNKSYGFDAEITGELVRGVQLSASYTFNINRQNSPNSKYFDGSVSALQSQSPKHLFKIWSMYDFNDSSALYGLRVGFGAQGQSRTFISSSRCTTFSTDSDGFSSCLFSVPVFYSDPGHIIFSASAGYKFNDGLRIDFEVDNLLDKTYYSTIGSLYAGNWYGAPRNLKATLRGKF